MCQQLGIGAQFGGKYFCHDVRVVRLPRHGASCPIGIGVSCSADRQVRYSQMTIYRVPAVYGYHIWTWWPDTYGAIFLPY